MTNINNANIKTGSLLTSTVRVEVPFIQVDIGGYTFGVYEGEAKGQNTAGRYHTIKSKYPNYVQSMTVKKINGTVNTYTLVFKYPVTPDVDPNFFEKVFSSVSLTRKMTITYGDYNLINFIYHQEEAIIIKVTTDFDIRSSVITYTVSAVSNTKLTLSTCYTFPGFTGKPSSKIKEVILNNSRYHLLEVFTGMDSSNIDELIEQDDLSCTVPTMTNISALDYLAKLTNYMVPVGTNNKSVLASSVYNIATFEEYTQYTDHLGSTVTKYPSKGKLEGPYLRVQKVQKDLNVLSSLCTYQVDVGYPTANLVTGFRLGEDSNWSIYYNYAMNNGNTDTVEYINDKGQVESKYSPLLVGSQYYLRDSDRSWWTKVTGFPVKATLTIKGLLKPAILMTYLKLNVWFYGNKHISSGYYLITSQEDSISQSGISTTLGLTRVMGEKSE